MKRTKRFLCVLLTALMLASICGGLMSSAAEYALVLAPGDGKTEIAPGAFYTPYTLVSGIYENTTVNASALEFDTDDYIVMAYTGHVAGGVATLDEYYDMAVADGYEVVGMINGSFFTMATGIMDEYDVVNGILVCADANNSSKMDGMTVLYSDGTLTSIPKSELEFTLCFNGVEMPNMLGSINKSGKSDGSDWKNTFYYFDTYSGTMASDDRSGTIMTYESCPGYEIVCKKDKYSNLAIGGTLYATVTEIRENRFGGTVAEDEFVLFMRSDSPNASVIDEISVGDEVTIAVEDAIAGAMDVTKDAISVFENPSWLVKDGENLVAQDSYNDASHGYWHNNVYQARWSVFGTKPDGSWAFMTSDGGASGSSGSVTLQDIALAMIELGCDNVIRMDGGGSVGMYVCDAGNGKPGYVTAHSRNVPDCIMVVKRSSPALNGDIKADLEEIIDQTDLLKPLAYEAAYDYANEVLANKASVSGDYIRAYNRIMHVKKSYAKLEQAITDAKAADQNAYAPTVWNKIGTLLTDAEKVLESNETTLGTLTRTADALASAVAATGSYTENVALGKSYTTTTASSSSYLDTNGVELTDGGYGSESAYTAAGWSGYLRPNVLGVTVDLGETYSGLTSFRVVAFTQSKDGIEAPKSVTVSVSEDGKTYTAVGTANKAENYTVTLEQGVTAKYIKYEITAAGAWCFISEVEATFEEKALGDIPEYTLGDLDGNGEVKAKDYMMLKRYVLGTYQLSDEQLEIADLDGNGEVKAKDYMMLKRMVLGTWSPN